MANETTDHLSIAIGKKLDALPLFPSGASGSIFMVPEHLRNGHEKSYEPLLLSIGPYHRGKDHLKAMEEQKIRYLKLLLERRKEKDVTKYLMALRPLEDRARECYAESLSLPPDDFVEMMLLDGCFIVELLRRFRCGDSFNFSASITKKLGRDLVLVENQLPFFVLEELCINISEEKEEKYDLQNMILYFFAFSVFSDRRPFWRRSFYGKKSTRDIKHLLSFIYEHWFSAIENYGRFEPAFRNSYGWFISLLQGIYWNFKRRPNQNYSRFIRCATELKEAGIKFKRVEGDCLFDIKFENGIIKMPQLEITGETESIFRNLTVYEQFSPGENFDDAKLVSDYMKFMDCLIDTQKDVELLCKSSILHNCLGNDDMAASMFNRLGDFATFSNDNYYSRIFRRVNKYCGQNRHRWIANLRHRYFNTPWAIISLFAAVVLLLLTAAQTVYSVLTYYKGK